MVEIVEFANTLAFPGANVITDEATGRANVIYGTFLYPITFANTITANGSVGDPGQVLHSNGTGVYWATDDAGIGGVNTAAEYVWSNTHIYNANITANATIIINNGLQANGSLGTDGQVLTSNGSEIYWSTPASAGANTGKVIALAMIFG